MGFEVSRITILNGQKHMSFSWKLILPLFQSIIGVTDFACI